MSYINCKNLVLGYEGQAITKNIDFEVNKGDYLCIVGENGAGKSTLVKTLLNLKKPMSGEIIRGDGLSEYEIGYLPQQTFVQKDFPASVYEVVISGCINKNGFRPFYTAEQKEKALANMERMQITDLKKRCYRDLSGGQQQRVLLARALCATGELLLLDEPVAGLDPKVTVSMYELIKKLNDEGLTIIMVSHDVEAAIKYASCILHMGEEPIYYKSVEDYVDGRYYQSLVKMRGEIGHE